MDEIEEIKRRIDVVDLISQYLTLKKSGANFKAICPFHQEKTPSFMISPDKQIYKCFGCQKAGDIFNFIMEIEGMNFREALELLAQKAGVQLKEAKSRPEYQQEKDLKTKLYRINHLSALFYHKVLLEHPTATRAREYLKKRGVEDSTIKEFLIGYAPQVHSLSASLAKKGFSYSEIGQAGSPDKFKDRIIFPLSDTMGDVIAFTGRVLNPALEPKYLNTPETVLFHKSRFLYGLDKAKQEIKQNQKALLVEGQMDVILSHQTGAKNSVASSGTALTESHLEILRRYTPNIVFAFDQDEAGVEAAKKSIGLAIARGFDVKLIVIPEGFKDAGDLILKDAKIWLAAVGSPLSAMDWYLQLAFGKSWDAKNRKVLLRQLSIEEKKKIAQILLPVVKKIPDAIEQAHYIQLLARGLSVTEKVITDALNRVKAVSSETGKSSKDKSPMDKPARPGSEETLAALLLKFPEYLEKIANDLDYQDFSADSLAQKIYRFLQSCYTKTICSPSDAYCDNKQKIKTCLTNNLSPDLQNQVKCLLLTVEEAYRHSGEEEIAEEIIVLARQVKSRKREVLKEEFAQKIKQADDASDLNRVKELMVELQKVLKQK